MTTDTRPASAVEDGATTTVVIVSPRHAATAAVRPSTVIPRRSRPDAAPPQKRPLGAARIGDVYNVVGALAGGAAIATLLFGWFAPLTGPVGWVVVTYLGFLAIYAVLVSFTGDRQEVADRLMTALLVSAGVLLIGALVFVVLYALGGGWDALHHPNFFVETMQFAGPLDPLDVGGIFHAIVGTLIQLSIALSITIPLGVTTAVFLNEVGGRYARFVRTITDAMTALPSIVAGLFVYAFIIGFITHQRSGFAAAMAITVMMLPIVVRATDVVLRLVPGNLRESSYALGSSRWRTVWHVVLPTARSGIVTAVILGTARGIGETSPVLLTSGITAVLNVNPFSGPMISLPLQVFDFVRSPEPTMHARGFGTAAVLILLVLALFIVARLIGGRGPGVLGDRQRRRLAARSQEDLLRMTLSKTAVPAMAAPAPTPESASSIEQADPTHPEERQS